LHPQPSCPADLDIWHEFHQQSHSAIAAEFAPTLGIVYRLYGLPE